jgi:hypothetical protein
MKKLGVLLLALVLMGVFFSCELIEGVTIEDRIKDFMADVNGGRYSNLYTHFHPTQTVAYNQIKDASYWNTPGLFPSGETYTLGIVVPLGETVTTTISSNGGLYSGDSIIFSMAKDGDDYKIKSLMIDGVLKVMSRIPW